MNQIDERFQQVVDHLASEFLLRSQEELIAQPDYGSIRRQMDGHDVSVAFWHYRLKEDVNHIVFITDRRLLIPLFSRRFISGVVFGPATNPRLMTEDETGVYD